ncbi:MAG: ATP-grasp domain-containing protein [Acidimicrobiia bacterium]|nr:ATP-grasp domain-containing protein [Acidimicrobiia bacterium]
MIRRVLVANRSEIARRVFRTCREMGIETVAVYSDADANEVYVADADHAVALGAPEPSASYLDIDRVVAAARATGADAIHPGYGFLSENPAFARACGDAGITFIGPSPDALEKMGSKLESKRIMDEAGVPGLLSIEVTPDLDVVAAADRFGYPILVKASAGGGGKGMRIVRKAEDLADAVSGAIREATSAFGDGTVFLEKYLERPRHVEIQVFGDTHGTVIHLFERDCSIQRRHQKIIEESPSPAVDPELRERMGAAAVAAARAVDYVGAGTVEFLLDRDRNFYFLEMNTRLQVEHPVTEAITGLDLVRLQFEVAEGNPLAADAINATVTGHAIEARLYAEDPANDYLPVTGTVERFHLEDVRVDTGVTDGSVVSIYYDPMLAKVIAHGATRSDAIRVLATALRRGSIHGLTTNRELLVRVLESDAFAAGDTDTEFLERVDPAEWSRPLAERDTRRTLALAAALAGQAERRALAQVLTSLPAGWRNSPSQLNPAMFTDGSEMISVGYRVLGSKVVAEVDGAPVEGVTLHAARPDHVDMEMGGVRRAYAITRKANTYFVDSAAGSAALVELPLLPVAESATDPGSLLAPMPGKVVRIVATEGAVVEAGATLLIVEAMKMEHAIAAPRAGMVASISVTEGEQVDNDQVLAVVEPLPTSE